MILHHHYTPEVYTYKSLNDILRPEAHRCTARPEMGYDRLLIKIMFLYAQTENMDLVNVALGNCVRVNAGSHI
jgi:hypothetical protein